MTDTQHELEELSESVTVLSASGDLEAPAEARELLCYLSDGRLLVAEGQKNNPHVVSYKFRLARMNHQVQIVETDLAAIKRFYNAGAEPSGGFDHTRMQNESKALLVQAYQAKASDIHIRVRKYSTEVHLRVHSDLTKSTEYTREYGERLLATLYGAMADVSDSAYKPTERQDARIGDPAKLPDGLHGVRIATSPTVDGYLMVMRLLYGEAGGDTNIESLGFMPQQRVLLENMSDQPIGMNIISGPTGSGKSTTLQRVLTRQIANSGGRTHIITVEDPPEYPIEGAVQTPVANAGTAEERSLIFSAAVSNAMRLDPDTIMVGEVRDQASAQMVLRASMTGHQVWTTVHANNAIAVIDRLIDLGLPINMVADHFVLSGLMSQRLCKTLCPACKVPFLKSTDKQQNPAFLERLNAVLGDCLENVYVAGPGCPKCGGRGTAGRTVIAEVIRPNAKFFDYIRAGEKLKAREYWLRELDGVVLMQHALYKIRDGLIDPTMAEAAVGHLHDPFTAMR